MLATSRHASVYCLMMVLHHVLLIPARSEPACSKFDYEEKMIEKMVRLEIKFEAFMEEFQATKTTVNEGIKTAKSMKEIVEKNLLDVNNKTAALESLDIEVRRKLVEKHDAVNISLSEQFKELQSKFESWKDQVNKDADARTNTTVDAVLQILQEKLPCLLPEGEQQVPYMTVESRVERGKDWQWGSQDGTPPGRGRVTRNVSNNGLLQVKWDSGLTVNYRMGNEGKYDLKLVC